MLVSITSTTPDATDLGYVLHKHPDRVRTVDVGFGRAHVFYPEAGPDRCTASLVVEVDPVALTRGRSGRPGPGLAPVRQRPALRRLVDAERGAGPGLRLGPGRELPPTAGAGRPGAGAGGRAAGGAVRGGEGIAAPAVRAAGLRRPLLDPAARRAVPGLGAQPLPGRHASAAPCRCGDPGAPVRAAAGARRRQALLGRRGGDRQAAAPGRGVAGRAPRQRADHPPLPPPPASAGRARRWPGWPTSRRPTASGRQRATTGPRRGGRGRGALSLNEQRLRAVTAAVVAAGRDGWSTWAAARARWCSGCCGSRRSPFVVGVDVSVGALERRRATPPPRADPSGGGTGWSWCRASLTYRDRRLTGFDAATVVEVVEHLDPERLDVFARVAVRHVAPATVIAHHPQPANTTCTSAASTPPGSATVTTASSGPGPSWRRGATTPPDASATRSRSAHRARDPDTGAPTQLAVFRRGQATGARRPGRRASAGEAVA